MKTSSSFVARIVQRLCNLITRIWLYDKVKICKSDKCIFLSFVITVNHTTVNDILEMNEYFKTSRYLNKS
jgi:hypothetical protein